MSDDTPKPLIVMRAITGLTEEPGDPDNPKILAMANFIARKFPDMADYCAQYQHDETAWCGLATAFCCAVCSIRPPFGPTDTDRFLWAQSFEPWIDGAGSGAQIIGRPVQGCIVVMTRSGGGHVTMFEKWVGGSIRCRGGNQSDCVCESDYDPDTVIAYVWPKALGEPPQIPVDDRPVLARGDDGPDVVDLQRMLPRFTGEIDGDFGEVTENAVCRYQETRGLEVDGVVGEETWTALYDNLPPLPPPAPPPGALTAKQQADIKRIANASWIADYEWKDRGPGPAPKGYIQGMALAFAQTYKKLQAGHPAAVEMAKARTNSDKDVFNEYANEFRQAGMNNERDGIDTLRHLYALMLGSGMRESSGMYCEGRDMSADNVSSDTCEAGLFQTSYNAHGASDPEFDNLQDEYTRGASPGYVDDFSEGVTCSSSDWDNYGSGRGEQFQELCKTMPAFAVETHALTLRNLCNHYGPIINHAAELKREADEMFKAVQDYMDKTESRVA
jgi:uncharacterized protein (TIGR02594 family)